MNLVGWVGVIVAIAFGVIAWLQGAAAARRAQRAEKKADGLEEQFSTLVKDVGVVKGTAVKTSQLAQDANDIAHKALMGVQESHDVVWDGSWDDGFYVLVNSGRDEALSVRGSVTINETKCRFENEHIGPGEQVRLDFTDIVRQHARETRERRERASQNPHHLYINNDLMQAPLVSIRVCWKSPGGVAHEYEPPGYWDDPLK